jgi:hypothetical protein
MALMLAAATAAQACSWREGSPDPIVKNVNFARGCEFVLLGTLAQVPQLRGIVGGF